MSGIADYLAMGGYARFVWPAYGVAAIVLVVLWVLSHRRHRSLEASVRALEPEWRREAP
ncbi:MAG: heme exporter protein CcmD [Alphaproteobacteria bacterium]